MLGACLSPKEESDLNPIIVAQTNKGNWVWIDENLWEYGVTTPAELEFAWNIVEQFDPDLDDEFEISLNTCKIMLEEDGLSWSDYIANN